MLRNTFNNVRVLVSEYGLNIKKIAPYFALSTAAGVASGVLFSHDRHLEGLVVAFISAAVGIQGGFQAVIEGVRISKDRFECQIKELKKSTPPDEVININLINLDHTAPRTFPPSEN